MIYVGLVIGLLGGLSHSEPAHAASLWPGWNWVTEIAGTGKGFYDWFVDKILQLPYLSDSERNRLSSKAKEAKTVTEKETIINEAKAENQLAKH
ncbi:hypothetical protein [Levilactobacillus zymae]|uniref:hypothetical protein n=1 Tax=Levilactobacillus zymae TaxID=267363 RepID=UPI0012F9B64A|nr:hypothetical protein [Levilactobacillus zymae]